MEKVTPKVNFTGYPDGKTKTEYQDGVEAEVPKEYATILRNKGLVAGKAPKAPKDASDK